MTIMGILLAAGESSRFGADKLLHPLPGEGPIGLLAARKLHAALPNSIAVVSPSASRLAGYLSSLEIGVVVNRQNSGMGSSLACAIDATPEAAEGWVITLADMPFIETTTIRAVAAAIENRDAIVTPWFRGRRGHPVGFGRGYRDQLAELTGDEGARHLLQQHHQRINILQVEDAGILIDIDTPADLRLGVTEVPCHTANTIDPAIR